MLGAILVVLLGAALAAGLAVAALLRRRGLEPRSARVAGLGAGAAGALAVLAFGFEALAYALNESGRDLHDFSPYVEYHRLGGVTEGLLLAGYALLPIVLIAAGALAGAPRARPAGVVLCVAGGLAVFLPFVVPGLLDRHEVSSTPVLHTFHSAERRGGDVRTCMEYGIVGDDRPGEASLCIDFAATPRSEQLLDLSDSDELGIDDVTDALNDRRVSPREDPGDLDALGLEVRRHRWHHGPPRRP